MSTAAAEMMLQCVLGETLSVHDMDIERRPYHKNCSCALHKSKREHSTACSHHGNIFFPKKQNWNDSSLSKAASKIFIYRFLSAYSISEKDFDQKNIRKG
ncbi:hypothetical protein RJ639_025452 [Escallonia herrerae]|uniref:Uncharacterized protein n=1 Tax=Escallonia herrerae TaxID=1293975 RepID=A0AA88UX62_9ASTE|nr:hypothetical protein RJ639_025452 [Escallonia herrerae]